MKLIKLLAIFCLFGLFSACGGDDGDDGGDTGAPATGFEDVWTVKSLEATVTTSLVLQGTTNETTARISGSNMNYDLNLDDPDWTTSGEYTIEIESSGTGIPTQTSSQDVSNVSGRGTYSISNGVITLNESLFDLSVGGTATTGVSGEQMANISINSDDELVIQQDQTMEENLGGAISSSNIFSISIWERK